MAEGPMTEATLQVFRGDREGGKACRLSRAARSGNGGAGCAALGSGAPGARSGRALELQGGQMRIVLGRGQWPAAADLQDAHGRASAGSSPSPSFPMKSFPVIKDLVTDVSWNFKVNQKIPPFQPRPGVEWKMYQRDVDRVQEFRKCIECFLCQDVCHVLREHDKQEQFGGPRFFVRTASLEMHPLDGVSRAKVLKEELGLGLCNITKCCTEVCPEDIHITDNAIIPLKERVVDEYL